MHFWTIKFSYPLVKFQATCKHDEKTSGNRERSTVPSSVLKGIKSLLDFDFTLVEWRYPERFFNFKTLVLNFPKRNFYIFCIIVKTSYTKVRSRLEILNGLILLNTYYPIINTGMGTSFMDLIWYYIFKRIKTRVSYVLCSVCNPLSNLNLL